jgi:hypothetical protein
LNHRLAATVVGVLAAAAAAPALGAEVTDENYEAFAAAYTEIHMLDRVSILCEELAPDHISANQAALDEMTGRLDLFQAKSILDLIALAQPEVGETLQQRVAEAMPALRAQLEAEPALCRDNFPSTIARIEPTGIPAAMTALGFDWPETPPPPAVAAAPPAEATAALDLAVPKPEVAPPADTAPADDWIVDEEVEALLDAPAPAEATEAAPEPAPEPINEPAAAAETAAALPSPAEPVPEATANAAAAGTALPMPTAIVDRVDVLPGLTWQVPAGVEAAGSGKVYCVWRCSIFQYGEEIHPWLIIHEALPLGAAAAIDAVLAKNEKPVVEQSEIDAAAVAEHSAIQAERVVGRRVVIEQRAGEQVRRSFIAFERDGHAVVTELVYGYSNPPPPEREAALLQVMASLRMDSDAVSTSLENARPSTVAAVKGAPPAPDQVIYAETPNSQINALTLDLTYDDDARYLDRTTVEREGEVLELEGKTLRYVAPQPAGTTLEGVFKSSSGYLGSAAAVGGAALRTKTLVFTPDGRFSTSAASGLIAAGAVAGATTSGAGSAAGAGTYRIEGYTLELQLDDGAVEAQVFFPYRTKVFSPEGDAPADENNYINLDGKVMYRDDG